MRGVSGEEDASAAVGIGDHQPLGPRADVERLVLDRHAGDRLEQGGHVLVALDGRVQREVAGVVLDDQERVAVVGDVVVAPAADRDPVEQVVAAEQRLTQLEQRLSLQRDPEPFADRARAAVAADEVCRPNRTLAVGARDAGGDAGVVLVEVDELVPELDRHARRALGDAAQQRLERVLRNQLVGLERKRPVVGRPDPGRERLDGWVAVVHERLARHVAVADEDIHGDVGLQARRADLAGNAQPPEVLHRARVAALHLGQPAGCRTALDQPAPDALLTQLDRERQPHRPAAHDDHVVFDCHSAPRLPRLAIILRE